MSYYMKNKYKADSNDYIAKISDVIRDSITNCEDKKKNSKSTYGTLNLIKEDRRSDEIGVIKAVRVSDRMKITDMDFFHWKREHTMDPEEILRQAMIDRKFKMIRQNSRINLRFLDSQFVGLTLRAMLHPDDIKRVWWDVLIMCLLTWILFSVPINLAFEDSPFAWEGLELIFTLVFIADIAIQFFTSFRYVGGPKAGRIERDHMIVAKRYLTTWFILDIFASFPFEIFIVGRNYTTKLNSLVKLSRIFKLVRVLRISRIYKRFIYRVRIDSSILRVAKVILVLLIEWHWIGCVYWIVVRHEYKTLSIEAIHANPWLPDSLAMGRACFFKYNIAFYWAVNATTGVGNDIIPTTEIEYIFTSITIIFGVLTLAAMVGSASSALQQIDTPQGKRNRDLETITDYLKQRNCSEFLLHKIENYYEYCYDRHVTDHDQSLLAGMHSTLKQELDLQLNKKLLKRVPRFKGVEETILLSLIRCLHSRIYLPQEIIYLVGEKAEEMFFVARGDLEELSISGHQLQVMSDGSCFGDELFLPRCRRRFTVKSITYSELLIMRKQELKKIMHEFPRFAVTMAMWGKEDEIKNITGWKKIALALRVKYTLKYLGASLKFEEVMKAINGVKFDSLHISKKNGLIQEYTFQSFNREFGIDTTRNGFLQDDSNESTDDSLASDVVPLYTNSGKSSLLNLLVNRNKGESSSSESHIEDINLISIGTNNELKT